MSTIDFVITYQVLIIFSTDSSKSGALGGLVAITAGW